jgi:microcystin synthetase protein McyA
MEQTRQWLSLPDVYPLQYEEVILAALVDILNDWSGRKKMWIGFGNDQRGVIRRGLETTRVFGCLYSAYPLLLEVPSKKDPDTLLDSVKNQIRRMTQHGLGYALVCARDQGLRVQPSLSFAFRPLFSAHPFFRSVERQAPAEAPEGPMHLNAEVVGGQLHLVWHYDPECYRRETVTRLGQALIAALAKLVAYGHGSAIRFTPSDFPDAGLDQETLDQLMARLGGKA